MEDISGEQRIWNHSAGSTTLSSAKPTGRDGLIITPTDCRSTTDISTFSSSGRIDGQTLHALATLLADRVKKGEKFSAGVRVSGLMNKYDAFLIQTTETRRIPRSVLRVILPDKEGNVDRAKLRASSPHNSKTCRIDGAPSSRGCVRSVRIVDQVPLVP